MRGSEALVMLPKVDELKRPLFRLRGIQPFHDFPEGPDWWNRDGYKAILGQLPKLGMNFFGLHTYPEGGVGPEPLVWIGLKQDRDEQGAVKFSYPALWASTYTSPLCGRSLTRNCGRTSCQGRWASCFSSRVSRPLGVPTK